MPAIIPAIFLILCSSFVLAAPANAGSPRFDVEELLTPLDNSEPPDGRPSNAPAETPGPAKIPARPPVCSSQNLKQQLVRQQAFDWARLIKRKTEYLPLPEEIEDKEKQLALRPQLEIFDSLSRLNADFPTVALVYGLFGGQLCVWLLDATGIVAADTAAPPDDPLLRRLWRGLHVKTGLRLSARSNGQCSPEAAGKRLPRTQSSKDAARNALAVVADMVLPPLIATALGKLTAANQRLLVIPTDRIGVLPFAALPLGKGDINDQFAVLMLHSADDLRGAAPEPAPLAILVDDVPLEETEDRRQEAKSDQPTPLASASLVVGDPDLSWDNDSCWRQLPHAAHEAASVASTLQTSIPLTQRAATSRNVTWALKAGQSSLRYIHFATHGVADEVDPADASYLALAGQHLHAAELRSLNFDKRPIVVMSACETGLGKAFRGGVFGLAQAWSFAGAHQVIMSLWDVDDEATQKLMQGFSTELAKSWSNHARDGTSSSAEFALATAMRALKAHDSDPALWAAFAAYGAPTIK